MLGHVIDHGDKEVHLGNPLKGSSLKKKADSVLIPKALRMLLYCSVIGWEDDTSG